MQYGRSPAGERWHRITGGTTLCRQGRGSGAISDGWDLLDRLPPRHDQYCHICFRDQIPATGQPAVVKPPAVWDLDAFLADLQAG